MVILTDGVNRLNQGLDLDLAEGKKRNTLLTPAQIAVANSADSALSISLGSVLNIFFPKKVDDTTLWAKNLIMESLVNTRDESRVKTVVKNLFDIKSDERAGQVASYLVQGLVSSIGGLASGLYKFLAAEKQNEGQGYKVLVNGVFTKAISIGVMGTVGLLLEKNVIRPFASAISGAIEKANPEFAGRVAEGQTEKLSDKLGMLAAQELTKLPLGVGFDLIGNQLLRPTSQARSS